jgi:hypothetical protein
MHIKTYSAKTFNLLTTHNLGYKLCDVEGDTCHVIKLGEAKVMVENVFTEITQSFSAKRPLATAINAKSNVVEIKY